MGLFSFKAAQKKNDPVGYTESGNDLTPARKHFRTLIERSLYRELRYNIPVVDAAITRLTSLNGTLKVYSDSDRKQRIMEDLFNTVPVRNGDFVGAITNYGVNECLSQLSSMALEQGFAVTEQVLDDRRKTVNRLQVPDALTLNFRREPMGGRSLWQQQSTGTVQIIPDDYLQTFAYEDRGGEYYSLLWNLEIVSDIILRLWQSVEKDWIRFGDPSLLVTVSGSKEADSNDIKAAFKAVSRGLNTIFTSRQEGKARDHHQELPPDVKVDQQVVGVPTQGSYSTKKNFQDDQRAFAEQLTVKTGLPGWMLNQNWSTTERLSSNQLKTVLHDAAQRQTKLLPVARKIFRNILDGQGKAGWIEGIDYWFEWDNVDIDDSLGQAQTRGENESAEKTRLENIQLRLAGGWIDDAQARAESERRPYTN